MPLALFCSNLAALGANLTLKFGVKLVTPKNLEWQSITQKRFELESSIFVKEVLSRCLLVLQFAPDWGKTQPTARV